MASLRKAAAYSKKSVLAYTRISKKKNKAYIKTVPPQKIVKFSMGDSNLFSKGKYPYVLYLVSDEKVQIRHNALEACRQYINKKLETSAPNQFFFKVVPYPHHIQRENKMLTGAGADRMSRGMQLSFGKAVGKAALLKRSDPIFQVAVNSQKNVALVRHWFKQIKSKLPCITRVIYEDISKNEQNRV